MPSFADVKCECCMLYKSLFQIKVNSFDGSMHTNKAWLDWINSLIVVKRRSQTLNVNM